MHEARIIHGVSHLSTKQSELKVCHALCLMNILAQYTQNSRCTLPVVIDSPVNLVINGDISNGSEWKLLLQLQQVLLCTTLQRTSPEMENKGDYDIRRQTQSLLLHILSLHFNDHFSTWTWVSWYQNVFILDHSGFY